MKSAAIAASSHRRGQRGPSQTRRHRSAAAAAAENSSRSSSRELSLRESSWRGRWRAAEAEDVSRDGACWLASHWACKMDASLKYSCLRQFE